MAIKLKVDESELHRAEFEAARKKGTGSFFLDILGAPLLKRPALSEAVAKYREGLTRADMRAGELAGKIPGVGKIFSEERRIPIKVERGLEVAKVENVKRLTAPLVKAQKFLVPIMAYEGLRRVVGGGGDEPEKAAGETKMTREEQTVLLKAAAVIETLAKERDYLIDQLAVALHEKQAHKLATEMADKGLIAQEELDKKAQELAQEPDLGIVKKAVDLTQKGFGLGKIEKKASVEGAEAGEELDPVTAYLVDFIHGR